MTAKKMLSDGALMEMLQAGDPAAAGAEARAIKSALASYRAETLVWAERRSATQPSLAAAARRSRVWAAVPQWSLAAVAAVTITAGIAHLYGPSNAAIAPGQDLPVAAQANPERSSAADIVEDNHLLSSIDAELSYHAASPLGEATQTRARGNRESVSTGMTD